MSAAATSLIDHVRDVVQPSDRLPAPPTPTTDAIAGDPLHDHPRPELPDWIPPNGPQDEQLDPGEEVVWEPEGATDDISDEVDRVPGSPLDVFAYYLPFHFYDRWWGIYIRAAGIVSIAGYLAQQRKASALSSYELNSALRVLLEHEAFHHRVEMACTRDELPLLDHLYRVHGLPQSPYEWYFGDTPAGLHEEAMANANAIVELSKWQRTLGFPDSMNRQMLHSVSKFMEGQPAGYKDFGQWVDRGLFTRGKDIVLDHFRNTSFRTLTSSSVPQGLVRGRSYFTDSAIAHCPIYIVFDGAGRHLRRLRPFPKEFGMRIKVHTNDHPPPHIHVELPIGTEIGRYEWPSLTPLPGAQALSRTDRRTVDSYLGQYGRNIDRKIRTVYPIS